MTNTTSTAIDMHNIVTSEEAIEIIETTAKRICSDKTACDLLPSIMLRGAPGVGKSSITKQIAKNLGIDFIDVRLAQMERVDLCGLPSVDDHITEWNVPSFWPRDKKSKGIILFDEITSAPTDCQVAAYSILLDRRIPNSNYELPKGWTIIAAGNRTIDKAVVKAMSSALANRMLHLEVEANVEDWRKWAAKNNINPAVIGYLNYRPSNLFTMDKQNLEAGFPTPRSWERVSHMVELFNGNELLTQKCVYGLIGNAVGCEFMEFLKLNEQFDNVRDIMLDDKAEVTVPKEADKKYAITSAVAYMLWTGKNEKETDKLIDGFYRYLDAYPSDFGALMITTALAGNKNITPIEAIKKITAHPSYKKIAPKLSKSFSEKYNESQKL